MGKRGFSVAFELSSFNSYHNALTVRMTGDENSEIDNNENSGNINDNTEVNRVPSMCDSQMDYLIANFSSLCSVF